MKYIIFNVRLSNYYSFLSGILVSLSINLFTTNILSHNPIMNTWIIHLVSLLFISSSIGSILISFMLESVRSETNISGSTRDPLFIQNCIDKKINCLWTSFVICAFCFLGAIILLVIGSILR